LFESPGTDEVFHRVPVPILDLSLHQPSLAELIVKKFVTPFAANQILPVAIDSLDILQDVLGWVEKTSMSYPIAKGINHPTLSPRRTRVVKRKRFEEDHHWGAGFEPKPPSLTRNQSARRKYDIRCGNSSYEEFHGMDARSGAEPSVSKLMR
jgi:hypothetical protein